VHEKDFVPDSGGAGKYRGGLGQRVTISRLPGYQGSLFVMLWPHRQVVPPEGLVGGAAGKRTRVLWNGKELSRSEITADTGVIHLDNPREIITIETAGAGGFGPPHERGRELLERDLRDGLVSRQ
jgi:N-methylhydantoinase B/oxoprolinase/acetone carboxylase alpha subunit